MVAPVRGHPLAQVLSVRVVEARLALVQWHWTPPQDPLIVTFPLPRSQDMEYSRPHSRNEAVGRQPWSLDDGVDRWFAMLCFGESLPLLLLLLVCETVGIDDGHGALHLILYSLRASRRSTSSSSSSSSSTSTSTSSSRLPTSTSTSASTSRTGIGRDRRSVGPGRPGLLGTRRDGSMSSDAGSVMLPVAVGVPQCTCGCRTKLAHRGPWQHCKSMWLSSPCIHSVSFIGDPDSQG